MMRDIRSKIWIKIFALALAGIFSANTTAYARHYSKDPNIESFFKSDLDQGLMYLAGTGLSIALPNFAVEVFNAPVSSVVQSTIIGGATNIGAQGAVAMGADPKLATIAAGAAGGLASGGLNLANTTETISTGAKVWTVMVPALSWTASAAGQAYTGENNPMLGMAAGMGAGIVTNVAAQSLANATSHVYFSADGKPISKATTKEIQEINNQIRNTKIALGKMKESDLKMNADFNKMTEDLQNRVVKVNDFIMQNGDVWRAIDGKPIVDHGFLGGVKEGFRAVSPGQWASLLVSGGLYEALGTGSNSQSRRALASAVSSFGGNMAGSLLNQSDTIGIAWAAGEKREDGHSLWRSPNYNIGAALLGNLIYNGVDYAMSTVEPKVSQNLVTNTFINGAAKFAAANITASALDKIFLTDNNAMRIANARNPLDDQAPDVQYGAAGYGDLLRYNSIQGLGYALHGSLPLNLHGADTGAGYANMLYIQMMLRKFGTGADLPTMYAYNFGTSLQNYASDKLSSSIGNSITERNNMFYGRVIFSPDLKKENNFSDAQLQRGGISRDSYVASGLDKFGYGQTVRVDIATLGSTQEPYRQIRQLVLSDAFGKVNVFNARHRMSVIEQPKGAVTGVSASPVLILALDGSSRLRQNYAPVTKQAAPDSAVTKEEALQPGENITPFAISEYGEPLADIESAGLNTGTDVKAQPLEIINEFLTPVSPEEFFGRPFEKELAALASGSKAANFSTDITRMIIKHDYPNLNVERGVKEDRDNLFIYQPEFTLASITPLDYLGRPMFSVYYNSDKQEFFDASGYYKYAGSAEREAAKFKGAELFSKDSFAGRHAAALNDGSIHGRIRAIRIAKNFYGPGNNFLLTQTSQLTPLPNVAEGRELFFRGNLDREQPDYIRVLTVKGGERGVRQDITGINTPPPETLKKEIEQEMLRENWHPSLAQLNSVALPDELVLFSSTAPLDTTAIYQDRWNAEIESRTASYLAPQNLARVISVETGSIVKNDGKVAVLPEFGAKVGWKKGAGGKEALWATQIERHQYQGLSLSPSTQEAAGELKFANLSRQMEEEMSLEAFKGRQLLVTANKGYFEAYTYDAKYYSALGLPPISVNELALRPISLNPLEEEYVKGAGLITLDMTAQAYQPGAEKGVGGSIKGSSLNRGLLGVHD